MTLPRASEKTRQRRAESRRYILRTAQVTLLSFLFLTSNTNIVPSLNQASNCRCADQLKSVSSCCCFNSSLAKKTTETRSCCSKEKVSIPNCCSSQKKQSSVAQAESPDSQVSSSCSCGNSSHKGMYIASPRDLNPSPVLISTGSLKVSLKIVNDLPITLAIAPDTPPPQWNTL